MSKLKEINIDLNKIINIKLRMWWYTWLWDIKVNLHK